MINVSEISVVKESAADKAENCATSGDAEPPSMDVKSVRQTGLHVIQKAVRLHVRHRQIPAPHCSVKMKTTSLIYAENMSQMFACVMGRAQWVMGRCFPGSLGHGSLIVIHRLLCSADCCSTVLLEQFPLVLTVF